MSASIVLHAEGADPCAVMMLWELLIGVGLSELWMRMLWGSATLTKSVVVFDDLSSVVMDVGIDTARVLESDAGAGDDLVVLPVFIISVSVRR